MAAEQTAAASAATASMSKLTRMNHGVTPRVGADGGPCGADKTDWTSGGGGAFGTRLMTYHGSNGGGGTGGGGAGECSSGAGECSGAGGGCDSREFSRGSDGGDGN